MDVTTENQVCSQMDAAPARSTSNMDRRTSIDALAYDRQQRSSLCSHPRARMDSPK